MMGSSAMSPADMAAVMGNERDYDGFGNGAWIWVILLFFLFGFGNNGFGNSERAATTGDVQRGFDNQSVMNKLNGIEQGLCNGFYTQNTGMLQGFNGVQSDLCQGFNGVNAAIANLGFQNQQCCCETNRNLDNIRYENAKNTCDIVNAIKADGDATRALMTQSEMQRLRDDLQTANFQLSQQAQSANLIATLRPTPIPSYQTCSPYESVMYARGYGYNNGCGGCC